MHSGLQTFRSFDRGALWIHWFNSEKVSVAGQERSEFPRSEDLQRQAFLDFSNSRSFREKESRGGSFPCLDLSSRNEDFSTQRFQVLAPVLLRSGILIASIPAIKSWKPLTIQLDITPSLCEHAAKSGESNWTNLRVVVKILLAYGPLGLPRLPGGTLYTCFQREPRKNATDMDPVISACDITAPKAPVSPT